MAQGPLGEVGTPFNILVVGDPGSGKTQLVRRLVREPVSLEATDDEALAQLQHELDGTPLPQPPPPEPAPVRVHWRFGVPHTLVFDEVAWPAGDEAWGRQRAALPQCVRRTCAAGASCVLVVCDLGSAGGLQSALRWKHRLDDLRTAGRQREALLPPRLPVWLVLSKADDPCSRCDDWQREHVDSAAVKHGFAGCFACSAADGTGTQELLHAILARILPEPEAEVHCAVAALLSAADGAGADAPALAHLLGILGALPSDAIDAPPALDVAEMRERERVAASQAALCARDDGELASQLLCGDVEDERLRKLFDRWDADKCGAILKSDFRKFWADHVAPTRSGRRRSAKSA
eukprot:TRINITY_DN35306_c0_g1_i2.p1 TRINITY_DN35306_c0_g1~~TRINITY_DN35306_c0_g1_i2.p1  ORF type:complete len:349 (+),score=106.58 TRINITY_DN35306_c0_g1_i2:65-1111(+)